MTFDPNHPNAPQLVSARAGEILIALDAIGVHPLNNPLDLLLISLLPLAIKKIINGDPYCDQVLLMQVLASLDLSQLSVLIQGDPKHG